MRYVADHKGVGALLVSPRMHATMLVTATTAKGFAESIAPYSPGPHKHYRDQFDVDVDVVGDRATATLANTDKAAASIEWGTSDTAGHHTLSRVIDWIEAVR